MNTYCCAPDIIDKNFIFDFDANINHLVAMPVDMILTAV